MHVWRFIDLPRDIPFSCVEIGNVKKKNTSKACSFGGT